MVWRDAVVFVLGCVSCRASARVSYHVLFCGAAFASVVCWFCRGCVFVLWFVFSMRVLRKFCACAVAVRVIGICSLQVCAPNSTMLSFVLVAVLPLAAAQSFPAGVAGVVGDLGARLGEIDGVPGDSSSALRSLASSAAARVAERLAAEHVAAGLAQSAYVVAMSEVRSLKYTGGCPRDLSGCPSGWASSGASSCSPLAGYDGSCGTTDFAGFTGSQKEGFAVACGAAWPCLTCVTKFEGCPVGWAGAGRVCSAPSDYGGACSPVLDASVLSPAAKAAWSAMCGVHWPCS